VLYRCTAVPVNIVKLWNQQHVLFCSFTIKETNFVLILVVHSLQFSEVAAATTNLTDLSRHEYDWRRRLGDGGSGDYFQYVQGVYNLVGCAVGKWRKNVNLIAWCVISCGPLQTLSLALRKHLRQTEQQCWSVSGTVYCQENRSQVDRFRWNSILSLNWTCTINFIGTALVMHLRFMADVSRHCRSTWRALAAVTWQVTQTGPSRSADPEKKHKMDTRYGKHGVRAYVHSKAL